MSVPGVGVLLLAPAFWQASAGLALTGDEECPSAVAIEQRLDEIVPAAPERAPGAPPHPSVHLSRHDGRLRLALTRPDGGVIATRELHATEACDDLASAAAVVIATWGADLNPRTSPDVSLPPRPRPLSPHPSVAVAHAVPPAPAPALPLIFAFGLLVSTTGGQTAPGAQLRATQDLNVPHLAVTASLGATTPRDAAVGDLGNAARWTRGWLAAGPELHFGRGTTRLEGHVQALVGVLHVAGVGLPTTSSDTTVELGTGAGVSVSRWLGNAAVWLGGDLVVWPAQQRLLITNVADQGMLPHLELRVGAGMSLGPAR